LLVGSFHHGGDQLTGHACGLVEQLAQRPLGEREPDEKLGALDGTGQCDEAEIVELRGLGIHERSFHCRFPSGASWWARPSILPYPSVGVEPSQSGGTSPAATARRPAVDTLPRAVPGVGHRSTTLGGGGSRVHVLRVERRMSRPRGTRRRLRRAV